LQGHANPNQIDEDVSSALHEPVDPIERPIVRDQARIAKAEQNHERVGIEELA